MNQYEVTRKIVRLNAKDLGLSMIEKAVLEKITDRLSEDNTCFPKQQTIADQMGCSRKAVNQAVKKLAELDYVGKTSRVVNGVKRGCYYAVNFDLLFGLTDNKPTNNGNVVKLNIGGAYVFASHEVTR